MKLTKAQERVLRELAKPGAVAYFRLIPPSYKGEWELNGQRITEEILALNKARLVSVETVRSYASTAGRAWLAAHEQSPQGRKVVSR